MMKQNLGKILILFTLSINLIAGVKISVNPPAIYKGDSVSFTISADGQDIKFPEVEEVGGYNIEGTSSSQSTTIINGAVTRSISKTYQFSPQKSVTIPSFEVEVDGKSYKTDETKVSVVKPTASKNGSDFVVECQVDKKEAHVGEAINFTLIFKQKLNAKASKLQLGEPQLENFWIKKVAGIDKSTQGDYIVQKIHYLLFPQKEGLYTVPPIEADIGRVQRQKRFNDPFFNDPFFSSFTKQLRWQKIFSNEVKLDIKPLPNNLELFGDFSISASVDKQESKANKPVNLTIKVEGIGNIDDVKKFELDIDGVVIYADEPKISSNFRGDEYGGEFTQKVAIIADSNYTIPPIKLAFVDKNSNEVKTVESKPIDITIKGGDKKQTLAPKIETNQKQPLVETPTKEIVKEKIVIKNEESYIKYLFLVIGLFLGAFLSYLFNRFKTQNSKKESDILKEIKRAKSDKALFETLLPYSKEDKFISETLQKLEENIYKNATHKIDKNLILDFFEEKL